MRRLAIAGSAILVTGCAVVPYEPYGVASYPAPAYYGAEVAGPTVYPYPSYPYPAYAAPPRVYVPPPAYFSFSYRSGPGYRGGPGYRRGPWAPGHGPGWHGGGRWGHR